jgi:quercetin dioxygenase-like cupin family protein
MTHRKYSYTTEESGSLVMEKIVDDDPVNINHIVVPPGGVVPTHVSNSDVHQIIVRGKLSLSLDDGPFAEFTTGDIVAVPFNQKMVIENRGSETLEFFVIKTPNPRLMPPTKKI